jgi:hypothetical protein
MGRAYISISSRDVANFSDEDLLGRLAGQLPFAVETTQRAAWQFQIKHLRKLAYDLPQAHFFFEFLIPRMGRRADLIILNAGLVFVVEYKLGAVRFDRAAIDQAHGYALDLKNFHETSHHRRIVPVLIATHAQSADQSIVWAEDYVAAPLLLTPNDLSSAIESASRAWGGGELEPDNWEAGRYRPTPTIVEAAQALYGKHSVDEISRSEAGAENLSVTADYVFGVIERAKTRQEKAICFITGVPGSGKTLAGLNLATARQRSHSEEHAVFLSGNGPLVEVLREALARDAVERQTRAGQRTKKGEETRRTSSFVQNIHHFRDDALRSDAPPVEKVAIFDEAQRAWDVEQTAKFMKERGRLDFSMSEPEFLLSVMDRHADWCTVVCLVGGGQEINTGEAGIDEWLRALANDFPHWNAHVSDRLDVSAADIPNLLRTPCLHLATSIRSFRAEKLSDFVGEIIDGTSAAARSIIGSLGEFPIFLTRDLSQARAWLRQKRRGQERSGLLASSNGARLKPHGIFVKAGIEPANWFLNASEDVRSSDALEDAATEFEVQGLELDWTCVCWDANFTRAEAGWYPRQFKGTAWQNVSDASRRRYIANSYRVLLTRARQGMVIFVPPGEQNDPTRPPQPYNEVYDYLRLCGIPELDHAKEKGRRSGPLQDESAE